MEKSLNYHDLAENDYEFLSYDYEHGRVGNILCSSAQNICERYLKHVIDSECKDMDTSAALHSHSLKYLRRFITKNIPDFECDWSKIMPADGYYFTTRYPGDDAFLVGKQDVDDCWKAVEYTRELVNKRYPSTEAIDTAVVDAEATDDEVADTKVVADNLTTKDEKIKESSSKELNDTTNGAGDCP